MKKLLVFNNFNQILSFFKTTESNVILLEKKTFACLLVSIFHNLVTECVVYKMHTNTLIKLCQLEKNRDKHANLEENHFQKSCSIENTITKLF